MWVRTANFAAIKSILIKLRFPFQMIENPLESWKKKEYSGNLYDLIKPLIYTMVQWLGCESLPLSVIHIE